MAPMKPRIVLAAAIAIGLAQSDSPAFAQGGSAGGTVGQHDKSSSGGFELPKPHPQPGRQSNSAGGRPCKLAMVWANTIDSGTSTWTISADGTAVEQGLGNARGHAVLSGHTLTINYTTALDHGIYVMTLNPSCTEATGRITVTGGFMPGRTSKATFTAAAPAN